MYVNLNGKLVEEKNAVISVTDHGFLYGDAVYETMRTRNGKLWMFKDHVKRLKASARTIGINASFKKSEIEIMIKELIKKNNLKEARIRITLSRGSNNLNFGRSKNPTFLIQATKLKFPPTRYYKKGISAVTYEIERTFPKIKSTSMLPTIVASQYAKNKRAKEALLVDYRGRITEGSMSNVFFVKDGQVITPKKNLLEGTVRALVIKKSKAKQIIVKKRELPNMDECFITSTVKGILPVTKINGKKVGDGKVGPVTLSLMEALN